MKKVNIKTIILLIISLIPIIFVYNDYFLYQSPIVKVINIDNELISGGGSEEKTYEQNIKGKIMNGEYTNNEVEFTHTYSESLVFDEKFENHTEIFVELSSDGKEVRGINNVKRDKYIVILLVIFIDLIILIAGKKGLITLISLLLNIVISSIALLLFMNNYHLVYLFL